MLIQRINRTNPEKVFIVVKAGENLLAGRPCCPAFSGTDDGLLAMLCDEAYQTTMALGIVDEAIASGNYGLVQCYGYRSAAKMVNASDIAAHGAGAALAVVSGSSGHLALKVSIGASTAVQPTFIAANSASKTVSTTIYDGAIFIRAM